MYRKKILYCCLLWRWVTNQRKIPIIFTHKQGFGVRSVSLTHAVSNGKDVLPRKPSWWKLEQGRSTLHFIFLLRKYWLRTRFEWCALNMRCCNCYNFVTTQVNTGFSEKKRHWLVKKLKKISEERYDGPKFSYGEVSVWTVMWIECFLANFPFATMKRMRCVRIVIYTSQ